MTSLNRFDLISLRLFIAVADAGSLTAGAVRFGVSLAAASKRIAELESQVGNVLLQRSKQGVVLTPAGMALQRHASELVARLGQMAVAMDDFRRGSRGHLRLWASPSALLGFLPTVLADFSRAHPDVLFELEDVLSEDAARAVRTGAAELAVFGENTPTTGLQTMVCDIHELVLLVPADHALATLPAASLSEALQHEVVALGRATSLTRYIAAAAELAGLDFTIRMQVRGYDVMAHMVAAGLGVAILPRAAAAPQAVALGLRLVPLQGAVARRRLMLAMRDRAQLSGPAQAFVELLEARAAALEH